MKHILLVLMLLYCVGCSPRSMELEPNVTYIPQERFISSLPSPFSELSDEEMQSDWGKELFIAQQFGLELDLYRSITAFKRAQFLSPQCNSRQEEMKYGEFLAYYIGGKHEEALTIFENSSLVSISGQFPAARELLISLYDLYFVTGQYGKAETVLSIIDSIPGDTGIRLRLGESIRKGDLCQTILINETLQLEEVNAFVGEYHLKKLCPKKAQVLNAILPGAGYYYVGQQKAAITSFAINTLFTAAAYTFFKKGYWAAGAITTSLELGWYIGGINGAGLAAKEYNECLYNNAAKCVMLKERLFPILQFNKSF